jgi:carboxymethylenebutenolidase
VKVYEGAGHGFACDRRDSYHKEAAEQAWESVYAMWQQEFA